MKLGRKLSEFYLFTTPFYGHNLTLAKATTLTRLSGNRVHLTLLYEYS